MPFSAEQSRRLDEVVTELAPLAHEPMATLVKEFADALMDEKFGPGQWQGVELLTAAEARVYAVTEKDVARELTSRLIQRLLTPHLPAQSAQTAV